MNMPFVLEYKNDIWKNLGNWLKNIEYLNAILRATNINQPFGQANSSVQNKPIMLLDCQCKISWWLLAVIVKKITLMGNILKRKIFVLNFYFKTVISIWWRYRRIKKNTKHVVHWLQTAADDTCWSWFLSIKIN